MFGKPQKPQMIKPSQALPGRNEKMPAIGNHAVLGTSMEPPFTSHLQQVVFGMGCFWGAEKQFWTLPGVYTTAVGYGAGTTPNPTYQEVCSGLTGHNEVVLVVFDPAIIDFSELLNVFWQAHNPTQGMRQGNDEGTQYRSGIYTSTDEQMSLAQQSLTSYQAALKGSGFGGITTEIQAAHSFYYAEQYHQQYLYKNPNGYCGMGGTGVNCQ